jgi:Domain of unknown function (DUF6968)
MQGARVIASRTFHLRTASGDREVEVRLHEPVQRDGDDYFCGLSFVGLDGELPTGAFGIDSLQALRLALRALGRALHDHPEFHEGRLRWLDDPDDLGLPRG